MSEGTYSGIFGVQQSFIPVPGPQGFPGFNGAAGAAGPAGTGTVLGFTQNDRQGRAALQTSADADNTTGGVPVNPADALTILNALSTVLYTTDLDAPPPYRTPITQASILSALQTYADGADELGPFQVDGFASGTGTIELESLAGFLVASVQGLGFQPTEAATAGVLQSSGSIVFSGSASVAGIGANLLGLDSVVGVVSTSMTGTGVLMTSTYVEGSYNGSATVRLQGGNDPLVGMTSATEPLDVSYFKPRELSLSATGDQGQTTARIDFLGGDGTEARLTLAVGEAQTIVLQANGEYGAGQLIIGNGSKTAVLIDGNAGLLVNASDETPIFHCHTESAQVSIDNALFSVARIVQPAGVYSIPASAVAKAFIIAINDRSSPVDVTLPVGVPNGTLAYVKKETNNVGDTYPDVTVSVDGGGLINDSATATISENYGSQGYYFAADLGQWFTI